MLMIHICKDQHMIIVWTMLTVTIKLLRSLGFIIHLNKSVLTPSQEITFLGMVLNSVNMTICLTEYKKHKIYQLCLELIDKVTRVTGNLVVYQRFSMNHYIIHKILNNI